MVTGSDAVQIEDEAMRSGCAGFVRKPIDVNELSRILNACLAERATPGLNPARRARLVTGSRRGEP